MSREPHELIRTENERLDVVVRPADGPNPPNLLRDLVDEINRLIPDAGEAAGSWLRGKGQAEVAKAAEIKANALQKIAQIEQDRQRLINERDQASAAAGLAGRQAQYEHERTMYSLRTQRLKESFESIIRLRELGAEVDLKIVNHLAKEILKAAKEKPLM